MTTTYSIESNGPLLRRITQTSIDAVFQTGEHDWLRPDTRRTIVAVAEVAVLGHGVVAGNRLVLPSDGCISDEDLVQKIRDGAIDLYFDAAEPVYEPIA